MPIIHPWRLAPLLSLIALGTTAAAAPLTEEVHRRLFLEASDLPSGMRHVQDTRVMPLDERDEALSLLGGQRQGLSAWVGGPGEAVWRLTDIRWVLPSALAAAAYQEFTLKRNAEGQPVVEGTAAVGEDCHVFGGSVTNPLTGGQAVHYFYLFRVGRVIAKIYVTQGPEAKGAALRVETVQDLARKAAERIQATLPPPSPASVEETAPVVVPQLGHRGSVRGAAFSPNGRLLASAANDGAIKLWDLSAGKELRTLTGHAGEVMDVLFTPDGDHLISTGADRTVRLWRRSTGQLVKVLGEHSAAGKSLALARDGRILVSVDVIGGVKIWDMMARRLLREQDSPPSARVTAAAISPDGRVLALGADTAPGGIRYVDGVTSTGKNHVRRQELRTGRELPPLPFQLLPGRGSGRLTEMTFSPDGRSLAVHEAETPIGSANAPVGPTIVRVFDLGSGDVRVTAVGHLLDLEPDTAVVRTPDRQRIQRFELATGRVKQEQQLAAPQPPLLASSPDKRLAVDAGHGITVWEMATGREVRRFAGQEQQAIDRRGSLTRPLVLAMSPTEPLVASGGGDGLVRLFDLRRIGRPQVFEAGGPVDALAFSPDGKRLAIGTRGLRVVEVASGAVLWSKPEDRAFSLTFSRSGRLLASGAQGIRLWDAGTGKRLRQLGADYATNVLGLSFCHGDAILMSAGQLGGQFDAWSVNNGRRLHGKDLFPIGRAVATSREDVLVAMGGGLNIYMNRGQAVPVPLFNPGTDRVTRLLYGPTSLVDGLAFSPKEDLLASAEEDGTVRLWDPLAAEELAALRGHVGGASAVAFGHDGRLIGSAGVDGTVRLWDAHHRAPVATLIAVGRDDFVAVTPEGAYTATRGGLTSVAFRLGERALPFEQFDLQLNRPDLVLERLGYADPAVVAAYRHLHDRRVRRTNLTEAMLRSDHLPEVTLLSGRPVLSSTERQLRVRVRAVDGRYRLDRLLVDVNNVPVFGSGGVDLRARGGAAEEDLTIPLGRGQNKVQISVLNDRGAESLKETFEVTYQPIGQEAAERPTRYVVAVGVSEHRDRTLNLRYAAKDAQDVGELFGRPQGDGPVKVLRILDGEATKERILDARRFLLGSRVDDEVVVFLSGHGVLDQSYTYYFVTTDFDVSDPSRRALTYDAIEGILDGVPARRKLLLMDTCQSGEVDDTTVAAPPVGVLRRVPEGAKGLRLIAQSVGAMGGISASVSREIVTEMFTDLRRGVGAQVLSSAGSAEYAFEAGDYRNGVFTYALRQGLGERRADADRDGHVRVSELQAYVAEQVRRLTGGAQTPTFRRELIENDFPLN